MFLYIGYTTFNAVTNPTIILKNFQKVSDLVQKQVQTFSAWGNLTEYNDLKIVFNWYIAGF